MLRWMQVGTLSTGPGGGAFAAPPFLPLLPKSGGPTKCCSHSQTPVLLPGLQHPGGAVGTSRWPVAQVRSPAFHGAMETPVLLVGGSVTGAAPTPGGCPEANRVTHKRCCWDDAIWHMWGIQRWSWKRDWLAAQGLLYILRRGQAGGDTKGSLAAPGLLSTLLNPASPRGKIRDICSSGWKSASQGSMQSGEWDGVAGMQWAAAWESVAEGSAPQPGNLGTPKFTEC